jgi:hypothetical protein
MDRFAQGFPNAAQSRLRPGSRLGCLGFLSRVLLTLALSAAALLLITAVFAPWGFFLGGRFHLIPSWQGWGTLQAKSGTYVVYVQFQPRPSRSHIMPGPSVGGAAYLCTPRGETFEMSLGGGMRRGIGVSTDGEKISLYMSNRSAWLRNLNDDYRPSIELRGQWHNPNIAMDDHGSLSRSFNPDGTVYREHGGNRPYPGDITTITLTPGSYADFKAACKAPRLDATITEESRASSCISAASKT